MAAGPLAEWLYEAGIGERRAALVDDDIILEALIERDAGGVRAGAVVTARLTEIVIPGRRAIATLDGGEQLLLEPPPIGISQGGRFLAEVLRESIAETGKAKLAKARAAQPGVVARPAPTLAETIAAGEWPVTMMSAFGPDRLEQAGWSELLEEAASGEVDFAGGALRVSLTPAMTLIDVDGHLPPADLAIAGAAAAGRTIRRHGIAGSIGIDLPTTPDRAARIAAATGLDAALPLPFERTAVNGFGFLQIVRRRARASLPELIRGDPALAAALALLRRAERAVGRGQRTLVAAPRVAAIIAAERTWTDEVARRIGAPVALREEPALAISAGHVETPYQ